MADGGALRRAAAGWMLTAVAVVVLGCGGDDAGPAASVSTTAKPAGRTAAARAKLLVAGRRVFDRQCSFCHRLHSRRAPRTPPPDAYGTSFEQIETSEAFVADRVTNGFGGMQSFGGELSPRQVRAVATYVVANEGDDVAAPAPSRAQLATGERVFEARCQSCHSIADRPQTAKPDWQATDFRVVKPSVRFVQSVLDGTGNAFMLELMPQVQGKLFRAEIRDVAAYVSALARPGAPTGG
jgi:mono/diheme cytochrome c family protein